MSLADTLPSALRQLRVAAIVDEFTHMGLAPECELRSLGASDWQGEMAAFAPHFLFVESAWWGQRKEWHGKLTAADPDLRALLAYCASRRIPTVYWGKEDPVHYDQFLIAASLFDVVFTADIACIARYKKALGHERVHVLPFACQPAHYNPVETDERSAGACFAGSYYVRYPERARDLRTAIDAVHGLIPVDIFDRYLDSGDQNYAFPAAYQRHIRGSLPAQDVARTCKRYRYGINMNTVKYSDSMFARRVFELLGSATTVISNFSSGMRLLFGELVVCSDNGDELATQLQCLLQDEPLRARRNLAAVRKVMQEHTYRHRLATVASAALQRPYAVAMPAVLVLASASSAQQFSVLVDAVMRQDQANWRLVVAIAQADCVPATMALDARITTLLLASTPARLVAELAPAGFDHAWIAPMVAQDYYGPHYLTDLLLATRYSGAAAFCKLEQFAVRAGQIVHEAPGRALHACSSVRLRSVLLAREKVASELAGPWLASVPQATMQLDALAIDPFNYCRDAYAGQDTPAPQALAARVDDAVLAPGISIDQLYARAAATPALAETRSRVPALGADWLARQFGHWNGVATSATLDAFGWHIVSQLADGDSEEVYASALITPQQLRAIGVWRFVIDTSVGLPLECLLSCEDAHGRQLHRGVADCNCRQQLTLPFGTRFLRLGWRITSSGSTRVHKLWLGWPAQ